MLANSKVGWMSVGKSFTSAVPRSSPLSDHNLYCFFLFFFGCFSAISPSQWDYTLTWARLPVPLSLPISSPAPPRLALCMSRNATSCWLAGIVLCGSVVWATLFFFHIYRTRAVYKHHILFQPIHRTDTFSEFDKKNCMRLEWLPPPLGSIFDPLQ